MIVPKYDLVVRYGPDEYLFWGMYNTFSCVLMDVYSVRVV